MPDEGAFNVNDVSSLISLKGDDTFFFICHLFHALMILISCFWEISSPKGGRVSVSNVNGLGCCPFPILQLEISVFDVTGPK